MKKQAFFILIILINIAVIVFFLVQYTNASYPLVGHDYRLFIPRLIDSHLYYKANGFGIEWYTPNFGGGLPAYPNPLQMQFSLPQLITWFIDPYSAVLISTAIYIAIGFFVTYLFLSKTLHLAPLSAILGADFFLINGFLIERVVVGHVNFLTFPLIIIPLYALLHPRLPAWIAGILISLTGAALVYSGGVYIAVIGFFSYLLILPLLCFIKPGLLSIKKMLPVLIWGGILTVLLCGSKLYATESYMRFFPRTVHDLFSPDWITGLRGMIFQLVGTLNWFPVLGLIHKGTASYTVRLDAWTGTPYGFWELDSSLAPGLLFMLFVGFIILMVQKPRIEDGQTIARKILAGAFLLFSIALVTEFAIAKGFLYDQLSHLTVLQSLHADTRYTSAFILPLAILAAKIFDVWTGKWRSVTKTSLAFVFLSGVSLASMWSYFRMPLDAQERYFDIKSVSKVYRQSSTGKAFPVKNIIPAMGDYEVFGRNASNVNSHYDPLFKDGDELLTPLVHKGSVFAVQDGYYNMTDPSSLVYPEVNGSKPFERIPVYDRQKLLDFINRRPSDWNLPLTQKLLDWISGLTILAEVYLLLLYPFKKLISMRIPMRFPKPLRQDH